MKYHIWTEGCQMNVADSQRVASALERLGYSGTPVAEEAAPAAKAATAKRTTPRRPAKKAD